MAADGIDPRYAAQFQRGFDPERHPVAPPSPVSSPTAPPPAASPEPAAPPAAPAEEAAEPQRPAPHPAAEPLDEVDEPARGALVEWSLLVAGLLLLAVAGGLFWVSATDLRMYQSVYDPGGQAFVAARNSLPGPLLVAGVLAVTCWLILRVLRRASR